MNFKGKTLLVLGGTWQQCRFVEAAKTRGIRTIVADYLVDSPAKAISDKAYQIDIKDIDALEAMARREGVDGVIAGYIDPAQLPYMELCRRLGVYCYGNHELFTAMTDKEHFKEMCGRYGVNTVAGYSPEDVDRGDIEYPVFVKPVDSRGSRGQSVCHNADELRAAMEFASKEASDGRVIVERYCGGMPEFQVTYLFCDGEPVLLRAADSYAGSRENSLDRVVVGAVSPSRFLDLYLATAHERVVEMLKGMGLKNGPAFMQGFVDGDKFLFFDPGLRFPGVDYDRILLEKLGVDVAGAMVEFALGGTMANPDPNHVALSLDGGAAAVLFPTLKSGIIGDLSCLKKIGAMPGVVACLPRVTEGETICATSDINQRLAEIDVHAEDTASLINEIERINSSLDIPSLSGEQMLFEVFVPERIDSNRLENCCVEG